MTRKSDLVAEAKALGIETDDMTIAELEDAIADKGSADIGIPGTTPDATDDQPGGFVAPPSDADGLPDTGVYLLSDKSRDVIRFGVNGKIREVKAGEPVELTRAELNILASAGISYEVKK